MPKVEFGTKFNIPNNWIDKISVIKNISSLPTDYQIVDFLHNSYLCESVSNKNTKIWISSFVANYLTNRNFPDCNVGLSFCDYLPYESNKLILIDCTKKSIIVASMNLSVGIFEDCLYLSFELEDLLTHQLYSMNALCGYTWKYLNNSDLYMSDMEKMYQDTFIHKEYVLQVCDKFADYLKNQGQHELANELRRRAIVHDNSKITNKDEFIALTSIINDKTCLGSTTTELSESKKTCIALHWKNNKHHPEYYQNYEEMSTIDRIEMVCDWMARSLQYKNNLIEFVEIKQKPRFNFSEEMYKEILQYCHIISELFS